MISAILSFDRALFYLVNRGGENIFFDRLMPFITDLTNFTYVLLFLVALLVWKERRGGLVLLAFLAATLAITDQFSSFVLKDWVGRVRPCSELPGVHLLTACNSSPSFPSSHAVNIFAAAYLLSRSLGRFSPVVYAVAALVGYSRVYIGVHYPLDVIGGAVIGLFISWPMGLLKDRVVARFALEKKYRTTMDTDSPR